MIIRMPIDLKSLYLNIKNDNQTGHTPTVATPLKQGKSIHEEIARILQLPETISPSSKENLSLHLLSKSRADARIVKAYVFDKISVNGISVATDFAYCIYIREETNPSNVHFGRQKVHYPQVLDYEDDEISISNNSVIKAVSKTLHDYAFIVQAFEYDTVSAVLNFDALIVGANNIPYSKVFLNKRGVGDKFSAIFNEYADIYDSEIIAMRSKLGYDKVNPDNFMSVMAENKVKAIEATIKDLRSCQTCECFILSTQYPYALFDIEVKTGLSKEYIIVRFTSTRVEYFNLPMGVVRFINDFPDQVKLVLVSDVNGIPVVHEYRPFELEHMKKTISSVTYEHRGVRNNE